MRIESSELVMQANYQAQTRTESQQRLSTWGGTDRSSRQESALSLAAETRVSISEAARFSLQIDSAGPTRALAQRTEDAVDTDPVTALIKSMVEMFTGQAIKVFSSADMQPVRPVPNLASPNLAGSGSAAPALRGGQAIAYDASYLHEEFEQLSFSAEGVIRTDDGQEIRFSFEMAMERTYREENSVSIRTGEATRKDPLILNFAGPAAQLNDRFIQFDLDSDGVTELLPGLSRGSAYLVLDRDGNGRIDNGRELFGPTSNNGYQELALLDADRSGWIDERDPLFTQLSVWNPEEGVLRSLSDAGVGALALARAATPFSLRSADQSDLGRLRETGLYLNENGSAGTLQEIDVTVR
ncbi:MAG: hypothetical protein IPH08_07280 [Rhodocyclaceae bacterium]|jgi:hypothetical protein|nr:hypothetical protein [Rhodocyclaceae bacterium]